MTLEELLNILCEKGWKPFGWKDIKRVNNEGWFVCFVHKSKKRPWLSEVSHRELVSKESGLWQFVCENGMIKKKGEYRAKRRHLHGWEHDEDVYHDISYTKNDYEYYIIESALKDESELEEFLLSKIKIEG